jgi:hypothetical protein
MSKAAASTSNRKSSSPAAALARTKSSLTFQLHPKQLVAFRSKATEISRPVLRLVNAGGLAPEMVMQQMAVSYAGNFLACAKAK